MSENVGTLSVSVALQAVGAPVLAGCLLAMIRARSSRARNAVSADSHQASGSRTQGVAPIDASQSLTLRALEIDAAARPRLAILPGVTVVSSILGAWLVNFMDWGFGDARGMVAVCAASLVATAVIAVGWTSEPEELERWALRAFVAAVGSALPALIVM